VLFPRLYDKFQGKTRREGARPALFLLFVFFYVFFCVVLRIFVFFYVLFALCRSLYCLCVYVYCTAATGWLPNCSKMYHIISY
jgi:hypothetical protein